MVITGALVHTSMRLPPCCAEVQESRPVQSPCISKSLVEARGVHAASPPNGPVRLENSHGSTHPDEEAG